MRQKRWFRQKYIDRALAMGEALILQEKPRSEFETDYTTSGLDTNVGMHIYKDDVAIVTLDVIKNGRGVFQPGRYVLRTIERVKAKDAAFSALLRLLIAHNNAVKPDMIRVDLEEYSKNTNYEMRELMNSSVFVMYHRPDDRQLTPIGLQSISGLLKKGLLILPSNFSDPRTFQLITQLIEEMRRYPKKPRGDTLQALGYAYAEMRGWERNRMVVPQW